MRLFRKILLVLLVLLPITLIWGGISVYVGIDDAYVAQSNTEWS